METTEPLPLRIGNTLCITSSWDFMRYSQHNLKHWFTWKCLSIVVLVFNVEQPSSSFIELNTADNALVGVFSMCLLQNLAAASCCNTSQKCSHRPLQPLNWVELRLHKPKNDCAHAFEFQAQHRQAPQIRAFPVPLAALFPCFHPSWMMFVSCPKHHPPIRGGCANIDRHRTPLEELFC